MTKVCLYQRRVKCGASVDHVDHTRQGAKKVIKEECPTIHGQVTTRHQYQQKWYILPFILSLKKNKRGHPAWPSPCNIPLDSPRNPHPNLSLLASTFTPNLIK